MKAEFFEEFRTTSFRFSKRPQSLAANDRLQWKLALVLVILNDYSRKQSCSLKKMNLLIWGVQFGENHSDLLRITFENDRVTANSVKFDPGLPRLLAYMKGTGLIVMNNSKYALTVKGKKMAEAITQSQNVFKRERSILNKIPKANLTEASIERALKNG